MIPYHGGIIWLTRQTEWEEELTTLKFPRTWWGGGGCILVIPEVREGGGVKYGSRLWYGVDIF